MKEQSTTTSPIESAVLKVLAYYHIFHHPLTAKEVRDRVDISDISQGAVDETLSGLLSTGIISEHSGYYFLPDSETIVERRLNGESRAQKLLGTAHRMSGIIYWFPFVQAVFISGSLSKGTVAEDADIDYFIITKKNKLWIARTLLVIFKRVFLLGSKKYFCVNYFVDEDHLEIPDKNIFTATEVSTLIPMRGKELWTKFIEQNSWYKQFYPNIEPGEVAHPKPRLSKRFSKALLEPLFFHSLAEKLDKYCMKRTYARWTNMYEERYSDKEFELAFRTHRGTSKNHDKNYQKRVLRAVEENLDKAIRQIKTETVNG
ncbi:MAG: hypothetical protein HEP71_12255 [Roseivirga sp.]|nr:hypothetical protein [Roseivirga sp.]